MIEQIKQALEKEETSWQARGEVSKEYRRWLRYLIGEVAFLRDNYNRALMQDELNIKVIEELRKSLEEQKQYKSALRKIVCLNIPMPDEVFNIANDALERSQP